MKLPAVVRGPCPPALIPQETCWAHPTFPFIYFLLEGTPCSGHPPCLAYMMFPHKTLRGLTPSACLTSVIRPPCPEASPWFCRCRKRSCPRPFAPTILSASRLNPACVRGLPLTALLEPTPSHCVSSLGFIYCLFVLVPTSPRGAGRVRFMFVTGSQCWIGALHREGLLLCHSGAGPQPPPAQHGGLFSAQTAERERATHSPWGCSSRLPWCLCCPDTRVPTGVSG